MRSLREARDGEKRAAAALKAPFTENPAPVEVERRALVLCACGLYTYPSASPHGVRFVGGVKRDCLGRIVE